MDDMKWVLLFKWLFQLIFHLLHIHALSVLACMCISCEIYGCPSSELILLRKTSITMLELNNISVHIAASEVEEQPQVENR